jgi:hypothetical protein
MWAQEPQAALLIHAASISSLVLRLLMAGMRAYS